MIRYADIDLDDTTRATVTRLVDALTSQVLAILQRAELREPVCSICIYQGQEVELDTLPRIFAGAASDRERIEQEDHGDWVAVWDPFLYRDEEDMIHPSLSDDEEEGWVVLTPEMATAWQLVRDALADRVDDPSYWVLGRVARQLNSSSLPGPVTDDVVVWVFEETLGHGDLIEQLSFVLPASRFAAYKAAGLIGEDEEASF